ncbi:MAG: response regulator [Thermoguttaceae bacterium]
MNTFLSSQQKLSETLMLDAMPVGCLIRDASLNIVGCNKALLEMFDFIDAKDATARLEDMSPEFQPCGKKSVDLAVEHKDRAQEVGMERFRWIHLNSKGNPFPAEVTLVPITQDNDSFLVAYIRDISQEEAATQAMVEVEAQMIAYEEAGHRMQQMINAIPFGVTLFDDKFHFADCNTTQLKIFGIESREEFSERFFDLSPEYQPNGQKSKELAQIKIAKAFETGCEQFEWMHRRSDGTLFPAAVTVTRVQAGDRYILVSCIHDVTEEKALQLEVEKKIEELREARTLAEAATKAKSEFLANMSHEIRTPMNAILGMTYLCLQTEMTEKQRDYLEKSQTATKNLLGIIDDILDFSKIEAGRIILEEIPFSLSKLLQEVVDVASVKANEKGLNIRVQYSGLVLDDMIGDPLRLRQVLINLTNNAIKFTDEGEVIISVVNTNAVGATSPQPEHDKSHANLPRQDEIELIFSVRDTGIGMTHEQLDRLFKSFSQADTSTARKYGGTGLGLVISKNLVELMGGEIQVDSEVGHGTTFFFTIRLRKYGAIEVDIDGIDISKLRFLVVDDDPSAREVTREIIHLFTPFVETADSGPAAIEKLRRATKTGEHFDLVLLDWKMPQMNGVETLQKMRESKELNEIKDLPHILMVSAYDRSECLRQSQGLGLAGFLVKPVSRESFQATVVAALKSAETDNKQETVTPPQIGTDLRGKRILLAEDNRINQLVAIEMLKMYDIDVTVVENGDDALDFVRNQDFDLVLMDIQMPVMDGLEATKRIRKLDKPGIDKLPILAMTANALDRDYQRSLDVGMNDHLTKPINPEKLREALETWIKK